MKKRSFCKVCKFLASNPSVKAQWDNEVNRKPSLKELILVLRLLGLENVSKSTISRHLKECEGIELYGLKLEKLRKTIVNVRKKASKYFINPSSVSHPKECEHSRTIRFWDMSSERVLIKCANPSCNKILGSFEPEENERRTEKDKERNILLLNSLRRKRR